MSKPDSIYRSYRSHWRSIAIAGVFSMIGAMCESGALILVASLAESLGGPDGNTATMTLGPISLSSSVSGFLGIAAILIVFGTLMRAASFYVGSRAGASWTAGQRRAVARSYLSASYTYVASQRSAHVHEISGQHARIAGSVISHLSGALNSVLSLTVFMISALLLDIVATGVFFVLGTLSLLFLRPTMRWTRKMGRRQADKLVELGIVVTETTEVVREIRTLGVTDQFNERIDERVGTLARIAARLNFVLGVTPQLFIGIGMLVLLGTFAVAVQFSDASFAELGGTALLLFRALTFGQQLSGVSARLNRATPFTEALNTFVNEAKASSLERHAGTEKVEEIESIEFVETSFLYEPEGAPAINQTTFTLSRPGLIAITGPSGTGKTTLAHIALGLLRPTSGDVLINGISMSEIDGKGLEGLVALVPQEPVILHASVMDNIQFYRDTVSEDDVIAISQSIGIHETIMALDDGYETLIGQTTRGLSGGQRQRIVIARAMVGNPSLIILDEPTSALDSESERWVMESLVEISKTRLVLVIAHRQETIDRCDAILRFDNGELVESVKNA